MDAFAPVRAYAAGPPDPPHFVENLTSKPQEKLEITHPQTVEDVEKMSLAEIQQLRAAMKIDGESW